MNNPGIIKELFFRATFGLTVLLLNVSCAEMQGYHTNVPGPKAKILFVSPYLEDRFMSLDRLALFVLDPDNNCVFTSMGSIPLSDQSKMVPTLISANRRAYFRLWQSNQEFMGSSGHSQREFSFIPEEGVEYTIEHIDNPANLRAKFYQRGPDNKKLPLEVQGTEACRVKN